MLGFVLIIGLNKSNVAALQSSSSEVVVKNSSLPCGKSLYTSFLSGKRSSSGGGSCKCHESSSRVGSVGDGSRRHPR